MNEYLTLADALAQGTRSLQSASNSPRLDAEILLARAIDVPRSYLTAHPEDVLDRAAQARYFDALGRRADGMPMAYITGEKEFWSMNLVVSNATLVPRPDTETLVEHAIGWLSRREPRRVLDLGTGSGAIALAIAKERPLAEVIAVDRSEDALTVARENARQLGLGNVDFMAGDWTAPVRDRRFDLVVSNPPYVRAGDPALEALAFEPADALVSGEDGLDDIRRIVVEALDVIAPGGAIFIEHGADQGEAVAGLLDAAGWQGVQTIRDLAGHDRVAFGRAPRVA